MRLRGPLAALGLALAAACAPFVNPPGEAINEPLFAGDRIVFTAPHGGQGGCAEGGFPDEPLELAFQFPPFDN